MGMSGLKRLSWGSGWSAGGFDRRVDRDRRGAPAGCDPHAGAGWAARDLRGWTQEDLAERLERYLGQRLTQAAVSSIERAWDGDRRREFDAHELLIFAMVFNLPIIWFLLPPPGDHRPMLATTRQRGD